MTSPRMRPIRPRLLPRPCRRCWSGEGNFANTAVPCSHRPSQTTAPCELETAYASSTRSVLSVTRTRPQHASGGERSRHCAARHGAESAGGVPHHRRAAEQRSRRCGCSLLRALRSHRCSWPRRHGYALPPAALPGVDFHRLFKLCRDQFLVSVEANLKAHLTEFRDHQLLQTRCDA